MHDIGKIVFREDILNQRIDLTDEEYYATQQHSVIGYRILNLFDDTLDIAEGIYSHHENWDGTGYPKGLRQNEIPRLARIIAVAECYDALLNPTSGEPYTKAEALRIIKNSSGVKYDPEIVDVFVRMMAKKGKVKKDAQAT